LYLLLPVDGRSEPDFNLLGKLLLQKLGVQKALFVFREPDGLKSGDGKKAFPPKIQKLIQAQFNRSFRPWLSLPKRNFPWLGFWPVVIEDDWIGFYALGMKEGGKGLSTEESQMMALLADRTGWCLERRRLRDYLEKAERESALGFLSAAMIHEIRNPLAALSALAQLLPQKKKDGDFMESFERLMLRETGRLSDLTENFLGFLKPAEGKAASIDFSNVVAQTVDLLKPLLTVKRVKLRMNTNPGLVLTGDEPQIRSLVLNLMKNALESANLGGLVEVSTAWRPRSTHGASAGIEFKVKNDGTGISKENLGKIFSPYFSSKEKGLGLGLAICQKIVENHHGKIQAGSSGRSTIFQVFLPVVGKKNP